MFLFWFIIVLTFFSFFNQCSNSLYIYIAVSEKAVKMMTFLLPSFIGSSTFFEMMFFSSSSFASRFTSINLMLPSKSERIFLSCLRSCFHRILSISWIKTLVFPPINKSSNSVSSISKIIKSNWDVSVPHTFIATSDTV